ncbi:MAG: Omp28 family outer membrane lipoprotein [Flavobacteriales bacterium]|nr:Omp28 family outer membrane lipoprotein [Flavobacteriales bacterium]
MKIYSYKVWFLALASLLVTTSCDKIEGPYLEEGGDSGGIDTTIAELRKILIEDFTGHTCGNCPRAAETATSLKQLYSEQLVVIAVHMGFFAEPKSYPDSSYAYDFRTTMGDEIDAQFDIDPTGLPKGMVNRTEVSGALLLSYSAWGSAASVLSAMAPDVKMDISNAYDSQTRTLTTTVISDFLNNLSGTYNVVVALTEDNVVNWQKDYDLPAGQQDIENYVHQHVLRDGFTGTWGDQIASGTVVAGTIDTSTYTMVLPSSWNENECDVVAYVYETTSYEVLQVEESSIK